MYSLGPLTARETHLYLPFFLQATSLSTISRTNRADTATPHVATKETEPAKPRSGARDPGRPECTDPTPVRGDPLYPLPADSDDTPTCPPTGTASRPTDPIDELAVGIEPTTCGLQNRCSAN